MPTLRPRHEQFVRNYIKTARSGGNARAAYLDAGYDCTPESADAAASRLLKSIKVQTRMEELSRPAAKKSTLTLDSVLAELKDTIADAKAAKQHSVRVNALTLATKLTGLLVERVEHGLPGDFAGCDDEDAVFDRLLDSMDISEALAMNERMRERIEARAAEQARPAGRNARGSAVSTSEHPKFINDISED
jgi:hypothetical protein